MPQTPDEKYRTDPQYRTFVDMLISMIEQCQFSPSEIREMAMLACIRHETYYARPTYLIDGKTVRRIDGWHAKDEFNTYAIPDPESR